MKPFFTRISQVGMVVRDLDATLKTYVERYGIGPWQVYRLRRNSAGVLDQNMRLAYTRLGNTDWLLFEPAGTDGLFGEFLSENGEGVQHLGAVVADRDACRAFCRENGLPLLAAGDFACARGTLPFHDFCDARKDLKTFLRIIPADVDSAPPPDSVYPQGPMPRPPVFTDVIHISFLCRDLGKTARIFTEKYGIGPWVEFPLDPGTTLDMHIGGTRRDYAVSLALCDVGETLQWELLQPRDDISDYASLLARKGEVFHNAALKFDMSYRDMLTFCDRNGIKSVQGGYWRKFHYEYRDFSDDLKVKVELFGPDPDFTWPEPANRYVVPD